MWCFKDSLTQQGSIHRLRSQPTAYVNGAPSAGTMSHSSRSSRIPSSSLSTSALSSQQDLLKSFITRAKRQNIRENGVAPKNKQREHIYAKHVCLYHILYIHNVSLIHHPNIQHKVRNREALERKLYKGFQSSG